MTDIFRTLFNLKDALPNLDWHLEGDVLVIRTWLTESDAQLLRDGQAMFAPRDLPEGYRWATAEEAEDWQNVPGIINVPLTADQQGAPYTQGEADLAVPIEAP